MTSIFEKAKIVASHYKGESLSTSYSICKGKNALKFRCQNQHTFFIGVESIESLEISNLKKIVFGAATYSDQEWCYKCKKFFEACKDVAA